MGIKTAIQYADSTVNPVAGCTGCELLKDHCHARRLCARYAGLKGWPKEFTSPEHFPGRLEKALKWKDLTGTKRPDKPWLDGIPRVIFVNDLSDGFCPGGVDPYTWLRDHIAAMDLSPHIWLLLTKWPDRMRRFFDEQLFVPDNFWLGTTVMRQSDAWRLSELFQTKRLLGKFWVSAEPLLSSLELHLHGTINKSVHGTERQRAVYEFIAFVAAGGETGPGARPMHPDWSRGLRDQCQAASVPFFFKSWGAWRKVQFDKRGRNDMLVSERRGVIDALPDSFGTERIVAMSKNYDKYYALLLDGQAWREMPGVTK